MLALQVAAGLHGPVQDRQAHLGHEAASGALAGRADVLDVLAFGSDVKVSNPAVTKRIRSLRSPGARP